jgi:Fe-S-cluster containining protein
MSQFACEQPLVATDFDAVRRGKISPLVAAVMIFKRMDNALLGVGPPLACRPGCSYCCHYHVYITAFEALALAEHINTKLAASARALVKERLASNTRIIDSLTVDQHILTNVRCALLTDDGQCSAYGLRPSACRRHHAVDVNACKVTFDDPHSPLQNLIVADRQATSDGLFAAAGVTLRKWGMDFARYEMNSALEAALTSNAGLKRWRDGKATFPAVKDRDHSGGLGGL